MNETYTVGEKIPTEDELSLQFQVGRQTVRNAVKLLEESGYLKKVQGSGTYVQKRAVDTERPVPHTDQPGNIALVMMNSDYVFLDVMRGASDCLLQRRYMLNPFITDSDYIKERTGTAPGKPAGGTDYRTGEFRASLRKSAASGKNRSQNPLPDAPCGRDQGIPCVGSAGP